MFYMSSSEACAVLGISQTTLKSACRKIGINKWPRKRTVKKGDGIEIFVRRNSKRNQSMKRYPAYQQQETEDKSTETEENPDQPAEETYFNLKFQRFGKDLWIEMPDIELPALA